jgi:hypothetical protein
MQHEVEKRKSQKRRGVIANPSSFFALSKKPATIFQDRWFQPLTHPSDHD